MSGLLCLCGEYSLGSEYKVGVADAIWVANRVGHGNLGQEGLNLARFAPGISGNVGPSPTRDRFQCPGKLPSENATLTPRGDQEAILPEVGACRLTNWDHGGCGWDGWGGLRTGRLISLCWGHLDFGTVAPG
jgi:hypothetical protein